jgi:hypothetical protein
MKPVVAWARVTDQADFVCLGTYGSDMQLNVVEGGPHAILWTHAG